MTATHPTAALGIDIGGTKLLVLGIAADGTETQRLRLDTPRSDASALVELVVSTVEQLAPGVPVGVGIAGIVDLQGVLRFGPNIDLSDVPLAAELRGALGVPVSVANDATVALYAELRIGAARGTGDVVLLTLGTGVGGAVAVGGQLVEGANGMAGELGHVPIMDGGRECPCGNRGCLEAYASGSAIGLRARELLAELDSDSSLRDVAEVDGKAVTVAALDGDGLARRVMQETGYWLGIGMTAMINALDPQLVLVGGGAATLASALLLPMAVEVLDRHVFGIGHRPLPAVAQARLGDDAGAIGAGLLALHRAPTQLT